ncbi:MAG: hypothetical protein QXN77_07350 [Candidatus Caldarchaeum sp.]
MTTGLGLSGLGKMVVAGGNTAVARVCSKDSKVPRFSQRRYGREELSAENCRDDGEPISYRLNNPSAPMP